MIINNQSPPLSLSSTTHRKLYRTPLILPIYDIRLKIRGFLLRAHKKGRPQLRWMTGPLKKLINPASFSASFTAFNFYLFGGSFRSSHGTTGSSGRSATAFLAFFGTTWLGTGNRTRIFTDSFGVATGTTWFRTIRLTGRLGKACCSWHMAGDLSTSGRIGH